MKFYIAGVQYHDYKSVLNDISEGNVLQLIPEPENKYDPNAVKLMFDNGGKFAFLGYVPKRFASEISAKLEIEIPLECTITTFNKSAKPWEMFEVTVEEVKDV